MNHLLKIKNVFADAILEGTKTFEIRYNDRGFQSGDTVCFIALDDLNYNCQDITHPITNKTYEITYVLSGWGLKEGYVAFGIKEKN